jgi:hypothetical protein
MRVCVCVLTMYKDVYMLTYTHIHICVSQRLMSGCVVAVLFAVFIYTHRHQRKCI